MNTHKIIHARGSLNVKIINSNQGDSFFTRYLGFRVQSNNILFHSPEDGGGWSDFHDLLRRWFSNTKGIKVMASGQITLDALPATPFPAFYGLTMEYNPNVITLKIAHDSAFASGPQLEFSTLDLSFVDDRMTALVVASGSVNLSYRNQAPLKLDAELNATHGLQFVLAQPDLSTPALEHPFLADFQTQSLKVSSQIKRWEGLQVLYTFGEGGGNRVFDYGGTGAGQNLQIVNRKQVTWTEEGLTLRVNYSDLSKNPRITAEKNARYLVEACQRTEEISIEGWIKTDEIRQVGPAEIITLEKNERKRNFALGQGPEERISKGRTARSVGNFLSTRISTTDTDRDGEPGIQSPKSSFGVIHSHVVFTRDARGNAAMYINGVCTKSGKISGSFEDWEKDVKLIIGNDTRKTGPWAGQLYQLAIYNQALTEQEVMAHYVPHVSIEGEARLTPVPPPLDETLKATWEIQPEISILHVQGDHKILSPQLHFEDIAMSLHIDAKGKMIPSGNIKTALWGNLFNLVPSKTGGANASWPNLTMHSPGITTFFDFDGLGRISMQKLKLLPEKVGATNSDLSWKIDEISGITLHDFPEVVDGISRVDLSFPDQEVWMSITDHNHSFPFIQDLHISKREKKFSHGKGAFLFGPIKIDRNKGEWVVMPMKDAKVIASGKTTVGNSFSAKHQESLATLIQPGTVGNDPANAEKQLSLFLGKWEFPNKTDLRLAVGFMKRLGNGFSMEAELDKSVEEQDFIKLEAEGCFVFGDLTRSPVNLEGCSTLSLLNESGVVLNKIFTGDINFNEKRDRLLLAGEISVFPDWSAVSIGGPGMVSILKSGVISLDESVNFSLEDFKLLDPRLKISNGDLKLTGRWMGDEVLVFDGTRHGEPDQARSFILKTTTKFENIPFQLNLGPIIEPGTGAKLADSLSVCQGVNCCEFMDIDMKLELSERGFKAKVNAGFSWTDTNQQSHDVSVPEFQLFWPPRSRNELLGIVLDEIRRQANELFTPQLKAQKNYFLENISSIGILRHGFEASVSEPISVELPTVFNITKTVDSKDGVFTLSEKPSNWELIIQPGDFDSEKIKENYKDFLTKLESDSTNLPINGTFDLIQSRIAERLPSPIDDLLFYHYGLDKKVNQVDIKPGMRLRVEYQNYQFVPRSDKRAVQGFVGSGSSLYEVSKLVPAGETASKLNFSPFMTGLDTSVSGVNGSRNTAGLLELSSRELKSFYRLVFPDEFADSAANGGASRATRLIGADTYASLRNPSESIQNIFMGRSIIVPEIQVYVNEQAVYVPLGTTLRQVMERSLALPVPGLFEKDTQNLYLGTFTPKRLVHEGIEGLPVYKDLNLGVYAQFSNGKDLYDLPLIKGDKLYL